MRTVPMMSLNHLALPSMPELDLADEAMWEDIVECDDIDADWLGTGRSDARQPVFGMHPNELSSGIHAYVTWWADDDEDCTNAHG